MKELFKTENYLAPVLVLEYSIDADTGSVYNAWTELEIFKKWFCPTGFTVALAELDAKPGGYFRIHMRSPEGEIYPTKGEYILLDKPYRIVYKDSWDDDRPQNDPTIAEVVFEAVGDKTKLKLYSSFATEKQQDEVLRSGVIDGWKMFFDNLNKVLKQ